jgi:tetratricopeptide (TPR) repeat protein
MKKATRPHTFVQDKSLHSKAFTEGINNLYDEIQLAFQWQRPSILLAIHNTSGGQLIAQQFLEKKLQQVRQAVKRYTPQKDNPDVINVICSTQEPAKTVYFISGLENANQLSNGEVYRALNIHREHLVEKKVIAVFWLTELEASRLPRFAPDFWAFRHRVVEFAPQRGPRNPFVPMGMFLWKDQLPWLNLDAQKKQLAHHEDILAKLPNDENMLPARLDTTLKLIHLNWLLNDLRQFFHHFENMLALLKTHINFQYHGWALNAKGIKLFEDGDRISARTCFEQALDIEPDNSRFLINAAILAHGTGKNREAILTATRAAKNEPTNPEPWHALGLLYLFTGKPQQAVEAVEKALANRPEDLNLQVCLAICHSKNNQPEACSAQLAEIKTSQAAQNVLQSACHAILSSSNMEAGLSILRRAQESGEVNQHMLLRDPNLHALVDLQTLMTMSDA